jgi:hypothetical protein
LTFVFRLRGNTTVKQPLLIAAHSTTQMVYVVTSFDFGGSSEVKIHTVTDRYDLAQEVYSEVLAVCNLTNAGRCCNATMMMTELTEVPMDTKLMGRDAKTLFWERAMRMDKM